MLRYLVVLSLLLTSCMHSSQVTNQQTNTFINDTSVIKPGKIQGLWLEYKSRYESSFVLILNDTIYKLKGTPSKYFFHHDTMKLTTTFKDNKKILKVTPTELMFVNSSQDTIRLKKAL